MNSEPIKIPIFSKDDSLPFSSVAEHFRKYDNFVATASSKRFVNQENFNKFAKDLEDVMRKHGVYAVSASIFADV